MDTFYLDVWSKIYYYWLINQISSDHYLYLQKDNIKFEDEYSIGDIQFYKNNIIEQSIIDKETQKSIYYIHFELQNFQQAVKLFKELMRSFEENANTKQLRVLLCCSGGLTTSYFAIRMNDLIELKKVKCHVEATAVSKLKDVKDQYDIVLLAPQVSYLLPDIKNQFKDLKVDVIPTHCFAMRVYTEALDYVMDLVERDNNYERKSNALS